MDHSYSSDRDSSRERERLNRQDHCYFAIADKTPLVVQRKVQQLQLTAATAAVSVGREDHTYGRQASVDLKSLQTVPCSTGPKRPAGKENNTTGDSPQGLMTTVHVTQSTSTSSDNTESPDSYSDSSLKIIPRQDHTYFESEGPKQSRKKAADKSRYDHVYCSATQAMLEGNVDGSYGETEKPSCYSGAQSSDSETDDASETSSTESSCSYNQGSPSVGLGDSQSETSTAAVAARPGRIIGSVEVKVEDPRDDLACRFPLANLSVTEAVPSPLMSQPLQSCRIPLMPLTVAMETSSPSNRRSLELITADHGYHSAR